MQKIKKKNGFVTIAQNNEETDYVRMAYALALSLKATQPNIPFLTIGIGEDQTVDEKYVHAFDEIVVIPYGDSAEDSDWKLENEWKIQIISPYENTIKLDADMLFLSNIEHWWEELQERDLAICSRATTYRGETANDNFYRQVFRENNFLNAYSALTYFSNREPTIKFFKACQEIFMHWKEYDWLLNDGEHEPSVTTDVAYAMASIVSNMEEIGEAPDSFSFVHMKILCQNLKMALIDDSWIDQIPHYFTPDLELYVGNFKQTLPFHYHNKQFLTDEIIAQYERKLNV